MTSANGNCILLEVAMEGMNAVPDPDDPEVGPSTRVEPWFLFY